MGIHSCFVTRTDRRIELRSAYFQVLHIVFLDTFVFRTTITRPASSCTSTFHCYMMSPTSADKTAVSRTAQPSPTIPSTISSKRYSSGRSSRNVAGNTARRTINSISKKKHSSPSLTFTRRQEAPSFAMSVKKSSKKSRKRKRFRKGMHAALLRSARGSDLLRAAGMTPVVQAHGRTLARSGVFTPADLLGLAVGVDLS